MISVDAMGRFPREALDVLNPLFIAFTQFDSRIFEGALDSEYANTKEWRTRPVYLFNPSFLGPIVLS